MRLTEPSGRHGVRVFLLAIRPLARAICWWPVALGAAAAVALTALLWARDADPGATLAGVRAGALVLCAGLAFGLDDAAAATLAASPTSHRVRRGARIAILLGLFGVVWSAMSAMAPGVPLAAATLEAGAMLGISLAAATLAARSAPNGLGGFAGGPALTLLVLGAFVAQMRWGRYVSLLPGSSLDPAWTAAHVRWAVLLVASLGVLVATARDPAARSWRRPALQ